MEIHWNGSILFYEKAGSGPEALLLFHGFGQDHSAFLSLTQTLSGRFTTYSFDLFYHGKSVWHNQGQPLTHEEWKAILNRFLTAEKIDRFSVLGFSIGARLAFATCKTFPSVIDNLILIAPDGIAKNFWFDIATFSSLTRRIFKSTVERPGLFTVLANFARRTGLMNASLIHFAESQMKSEEKRKKVYYTWMVFRKLAHNKDELIRMIANRKTLIYLSKDDQVIPLRKINGFLSKIDSSAVQILDSKHHHLIPAVTRLLKSDLTIQSDTQH
jgi:pimeloyl-ACP methyl ester carboxylesterase